MKKWLFILISLFILCRPSLADNITLREFNVEGVKISIPRNWDITSKKENINSQTTTDSLLSGGTKSPEILFGANYNTGKNYASATLVLSRKSIKCGTQDALKTLTRKELQSLEKDQELNIKEKIKGTGCSIDGDYKVTLFSNNGHHALRSTYIAKYPKGTYYMIDNMYMFGSYMYIVSIGYDINDRPTLDRTIDAIFKSIKF